MKPKLLVLLIDYNQNLLNIDYLINNFKCNIIDILNIHFDISIDMYMSIYENYNNINYSKFLNICDIKTKLLSTGVNNINLYENEYLHNSNIYRINYKPVHQYISNKLDNNYSNKLDNNYSYIFYIPVNSYMFGNINQQLFNTKIIFDKISKSFILPNIYIDELENLLNNENHMTNNILYKNIITSNIEIKLSGNNILQNFDNIKQYIGLVPNIIINDYSYLSNPYIINVDKELFNIKLNKIDNIDMQNINIAIIIVGQVRTFIYKHVYMSLKEHVIDILEENNINYKLFFYIENKMVYSHHHMKQYNLSYDKCKYHINKDDIEYNIKKITNKYIIEYYKLDDIIKKIPIIVDNTHSIQNYLFITVYNKVLEYEKNNNMSFDYIIKTRPDMKYMYSINNIIDFKKKNNFFIHDHDYLFIFNKELAKSIIFSQYICFNPVFDHKCFKYFIQLMQKDIIRYVSNNYLNNKYLCETLNLPWDQFDLSELLSIDSKTYNRHRSLRKEIKIVEHNSTLGTSLIISPSLWDKNIETLHSSISYHFDRHWIFPFIMAINNIMVLHPINRFVGITTTLSDY
jgi:hypothetical protein